MTIQAAPSEQSYAADGVSTIFPIPFPFDTAADLKLTSTDSAGNILTLSTGFTISGGAGSTGNATFSVAPAAGLTLTIYDNPALTQPTNYVSLDAFPAESHEKALDRVTRIAKRLNQLVLRSVRFPDGDVSTDGVLGSVANRKGKYLFFNAVTGAIEYAVNIVNTTLSKSIIAQLLNPQSAAELAASVAPIVYSSERAGAFSRYNMDPTGVTSSSAAFGNAAKSNDYVFDDFPGGGLYKFDASVAISKYPLRIEGSMRGDIGGAILSGTRFQLSTLAGASAACLNFSSFSDLEVSKIKFLLKNAALSQIGMRFAELRASNFEKCSFLGQGTINDDTTGMRFDGTGTFTGDVTIDRCYFSNHQFCVHLLGSVTDLRVLASAFYGTAAHASSRGLSIASANCNGLMVIGNSFNIWKRGIYSIGSGIKQIGNRFEDTNPQWEWVIGSATKHQSLGDTVIGGGLPIFSQTDADAHLVMGAAGAFSAGQPFQANRGFQEGAGAGSALRAFNMGYPQTTAGTFTASGAMTWNAAGNLIWSIVGKTMTVSWNFFNTTIAGTPDKALQILIPGSFVSAENKQVPCTIQNNGAFSNNGSATIASGAGNTLIKVYIDPSALNNWTASAANGGTSGSITFFTT